MTLGLEWPRQSELADFRYLAIVDSCGNARVQPFHRFTCPSSRSPPAAAGGRRKVLRVFPQGGWIRVTAFNLDAPAAGNVVNATYRVTSRRSRTWSSRARRACSSESAPGLRSLRPVGARPGPTGASRRLAPGPRRRRPRRRLARRALCRRPQAAGPNPSLDAGRGRGQARPGAQAPVAARQGTSCKAAAPTAAAPAPSPQGPLRGPPPEIVRPRANGPGAPGARAPVGGHRPRAAPAGQLPPAPHRARPSGASSRPARALRLVHPHRPHHQRRVRFELLTDGKWIVRPTPPSSSSRPWPRTSTATPAFGSVVERSAQRGRQGGASLRRWPCRELAPQQRRATRSRSPPDHRSVTIHSVPLSGSSQLRDLEPLGAASGPT